MEREYSNALEGVNRVVEANALSFQSAVTLSEALLGFRIGHLGFLLPVSLHCEVIEALPVNPVPKVEPWFSGLLNIRGNIVPVVDLRLLLGETLNPLKKRYLLALGRGEKMMALWLDDYPQMMMALTDPLPDLPYLPPPLVPCVRHAYAHQEQIWLTVQLEPLFTALGARQTNQESTL